MNRTLIIAVCASGFLLGSLSASAQYSKFMMRDKAPSLTRAETARLTKLAHSLTAEEPTERLKQAGTALEAALTTSPVFRQSLETVKAMGRAVAKKEGATVEEIMALYGDPSMNKAAFVYCLPAFVGRLPLDKRLAALDAVENAAAIDGLIDEGARLALTMTRAAIHADLGDCENAIATLEKIGDAKGLSAGAHAIYSRDRWPFVPNKKELLNKATPEQIERIAAIQDNWAGAVERELGADARAFVASTQLRTEAGECRRLAAVKRAAAKQVPQ